MKFRYIAALVAASVISNGCGKRDRAEPAKSSDGVESFKFVPRDPSKYTATPQKKSENAQAPNQEKPELDTRRPLDPSNPRQ